MNPELLAYLLANCSADIHLHCGPAGQPAMYSQIQPGHLVGASCGERYEHARCPAPCPEIDYSNPNQPYFWDHTEMN